MNNGIIRTVFFIIFINIFIPAFADGSMDRNPHNGSELQRFFNLLYEIQKISSINDQADILPDSLIPGSALIADNYFIGLNTYQHYGVYIGDGKVIHFAPTEGQEISFENGIIHETTLERFLDGRALQIDKNIKRAFSEQEIINRARSRLGEK